MWGYRAIEGGSFLNGPPLSDVTSGYMVVTSELCNYGDRRVSEFMSKVDLTAGIQIHLSIDFKKNNMNGSIEQFFFS